MDDHTQLYPLPATYRTAFLTTSIDNLNDVTGQIILPGSICMAGALKYFTSQRILYACAHARNNVGTSSSYEEE